MSGNKFFFLLFVTLVFSGIVPAQSPVLEVHRWDSNPIRVELSQLGRITFAGTNMNLNLKSGAVTEVPTNTIRNLVFGTVTSVQPAAEALKMTLSPNPATDFIRLTHIKPEVRVVSLYSLSGQLIQQVRVTEQELVIAVDQLHRGIYFVRAGNEVVKFSKE